MAATLYMVRRNKNKTDDANKSHIVNVKIGYLIKLADEFFAAIKEDRMRVQNGLCQQSRKQLPGCITKMTV